MKFSIGTASSSLEFEEDMRLIKSSLLYADEIELIGMAEYAVFTYLPRCITEKRDIQKLINNFVILLQAFENEESAQLVMELEKIQNELVPILPMINKKKGRNKDEILAQMQMKQLLKQCREQLNDKEVDGVIDNDKCKALAKKIKDIIDTKSSFADWLNNQNVRNGLKLEIKICLVKNGYPPQYSPEVFNKVMEQVENFEEHSGETVEKGNNASAKVYQYEMPEGNVMMVAEKTTPYGKL